MQQFDIGTLSIDFHNEQNQVLLETQDVTERAARAQTCPECVGINLRPWLFQYIMYSELAGY